MGLGTASALTASSQTITLGLTASARAMPLRWRWAPENLGGQWHCLSTEGSPAPQNRVCLMARWRIAQ
jgi:hypothetical protein